MVALPFCKKAIESAACRFSPSRSNWRVTRARLGDGDGADDVSCSRTIATRASNLDGDGETTLDLDGDGETTLDLDGDAETSAETKAPPVDSRGAARVGDDALSNSDGTAVAACDVAVKENAVSFGDGAAKVDAAPSAGER